VLVSLLSAWPTGEDDVRAAVVLDGQIRRYRDEAASAQYGIAA
jgi:hypothetical protein